VNSNGVVETEPNKRNRTVRELTQAEKEFMSNSSRVSNKTNSYRVELR
jgi:hypothetical protein